MQLKLRIDETRLTDIRIRKHKPLIQFILHPVHLAPNNTEERFTINQHLDPILLHLFVKFPSFVHVFQIVCQTGTASVLNAYADEFGGGESEQAVELSYGGWGEGHGCFPGAELGGAFWF